jgi:hypothetical protein
VPHEWSVSPPPLIKPDERISVIGLSDRLHLATVSDAPMCTRRTPKSPNSSWSGNRCVTGEGTLCRRARNPLTAA